jgi:hypothetical protein
VDVQMRHAIAEDKRIDVLGIRRVLQHAGKAVHQSAEGACFIIAEVAESWRVTLWFDRQPAPVRGGSPVSVTRVHEIVLIENPAIHRTP